jgi:hypothetical protein
LEVPGSDWSWGTSTFNLHPQFLEQRLSHLIIPLPWQKINREYAKEKKYYVSTPPCPSTQQLLPYNQQARFPIIKNKNERGGVDLQDQNTYITFNKSACTQLFAGMHTAFHTVIFQNIQHHMTAIFVSKSNDKLVPTMTFHNS